MPVYILGMSYKGQILLALRRCLCTPLVFVVHLFSFLCCVFVVVCLSFVPNVAIFPGLFILDCPFGFL